MTIFEERAPAKINLTLDIVGKRPDGYHELRSLVAFARDAVDHVVLDIERPSGCSVTGPFGATIAGQNLIDVTLSKLAAADNRLRLGHVTLTKNLPVAAGIGGGSADAAAVLRAVQRANADRAHIVDWQAIALSLGADVPVCLLSALAWMTSIGENVSRLAPSHFVLPHLVVANPLVAVPADKTAQVFRALQAKPLQPAQRAAPDFQIDDERMDLRAFIALGRNDLERAALAVVPSVAGVLTELAALPAARLARMSGGGPTCFAMFDTADQATAACAVMRAKRPDWWVVATALD